MAPAPAVAGAQSAVDKCFAIAATKRSPRADAPEKVIVKEIVVRYGARSREEACMRAFEARTKLEGGADFDDVVNAYSDEKGVVRTISRNEVGTLFGAAAFELAPNSVGHVVEAEDGYYVIMRTE